MKTLVTIKNLRTLGVMVFVLVASLAFNPVHAQTEAEGKTITGVVSNSEGPIAEVNVMLKGSRVGTTTDKDGAFTFPMPLSVGDQLVFTYLGYVTQIYEIKEDTTTIAITLAEDAIEFVGAPNTDQPYKSKRVKE